ncbi:distal tail protein Dit [Lederbergia galactosidilytica]|nr:distal tail protein Dit [Lederbergia galactosidilytica]
MTYNGIQQPFVTVLEKKRPYWTPLKRNIRMSRSGRPRLISTEKELLVQPVTLLIEGNSKSDLLNKAEEVASWLVTKEAKRLTFSDQPNRHYLAVIDGEVDVNEIVSFSRITVQFICLEKLGEEHTLSLTSTSKKFVIAGQESTPWKSYTKFATPQSSFTLESSVGKVLLEYKFIAGDVLEIDYEKRDVKLNGKDLSISVLLETVWFELPVGEISLKSSVPTELTYDERYY